MKSKSYPILLCSFLFVILTVERTNAQVTQQTLQQIESLIKEKNLRTSAEQKISSQLLQAVKEKAGLRMAEGVSLDTVNVHADRVGNLEVDMKADVTDELLMKIESLGGKIIFPSAEYHTLRAKINLSAVKTIAAFPEVKFIQPAEEMQVIGTEFFNTKKIESENCTAKDYELIRQQLSKYLKTIAAKEVQGSDGETGVTSEGDRTHRADDARATYGYSGEGIKIGVLSDSYNALKGAAADIKKGELPGTGNPYGNTTPVTVVQDYLAGTDEGRAMLQIVHDIAPKAQLFFATANFGSSNFATNIKKLRNAYHCDIIIDDVHYLGEPPFQDGIIAQAVNDVTTDGALYFASQGNNGSLAKNSSCVYEGDFNDAGSLPFTGGSKNGTVHNFGAVSKPEIGDSLISFFTAADGVDNRYILDWSDPIGASSNDYDLFLIKKDGTVRASSTDIQNGTQDPIEFINAAAAVKDGDKLVVFKTTAAKVRAFWLNAGFASYNGISALKHVTAGQTFGHSAAAAAYSVAATPALAEYPNAFSSADLAETFSSDGPRRVFYNANGTAITPNNFLFSTNGGTDRKKPDITAADGVSTNVDSSDEFTLFYGTSAAAPHAGAIAALLKSADPTLTTAQMRTLLTGTALDIELTGYDNISGYGILQAFKAMQQLNPKAYAALAFDSAFTKDAAPSNNNGFIDPGETGNITVKIKNTSIANATSVSATLSTTAAGITITQAQVSFGTISSGTSVKNTSPFVIKVANTVPCGTTVSFTLTVNYSGGKTSPVIFKFDIPIGTQPYLNITAALGNPLTGNGYTILTGTQTGRLGRYLKIGSTCNAPVDNPGISQTAGFAQRRFDAYKFTNNTTVSQCVTATLTSRTSDSIYTATYNDSGFVPSNPAKHFLAEPQYISGGILTYSFNVPAKKSFTVVVHEVYGSTLTGVPYNLSVSLSDCSGVLAVSGLKLTATTDELKQVPLQWTAVDEINVRSYEVQRSTDGAHFASLSSLQAISGGTQHTYNYTDKLPVSGNNYYRIKETDNNGNIAYSNVVRIIITAVADILIMPNPASDYVNIIAKTSITQLQVLNAKGQVLQTIKPLANSYKLHVNAMPSGEYFLRIETNDGVVNKKFIKQ